MKIFLFHSKYVKEILDVLCPVHDIRLNLSTKLNFPEKLNSRKGYIE
jgi:hypothetical protein